MILEALKRKATDIHFIVLTRSCLIKLRINEALEPLKEIDLLFYQRLVIYIKYKSNMNLNISKSPQSSALNISINNSLFRIRVSTLPSNEHESIVFRINNSQFSDGLEQLLLFKEQSTIFNQCLVRKSGLILITGPTGSGKTTLSYSLLHQFRSDGLCVVTIEDPVEHYEKGLVQLQINENAGVTYETGVKEILRHDPDVIFIGEIRDSHTARSAIRAALTGHLVISTMHSYDCLKALYRFLEFGLSLLDLEQTLLLVTNQRLIVNSTDKKIVLEYLDFDKMMEALDYIKLGGEFNYKRINDYMDNVLQYSIIKK